MRRVLVVTAVRAETRAVLRAMETPLRLRGAGRPTWQGEVGGNRVRVVEGGVGREAAGYAVAAHGAGCDTIVSLGFAGALSRDLRPGDLVVPETVVWEEGGVLRRYGVRTALLDAALEALARAQRPRPSVATLLSSPVVLASATAKRDAGRRYAAVAVEMETAALATYAAEHGGDVLALRAVLDPVELSLDRLPPGVEASWKARAQVAVAPRAWPLVVRLSRHAVAASRTLTGAAAAVLPVLCSETPGASTD